METHRHLIDLYRSNAASRQDHVCITHLESGLTVSYAEVWRKTLQWVEYLRSAGIKPKERIIFAVRNHWAIYPLLAACNAQRIVLCPVDPDLHRDELSQIVSDMSPALLFVKDQGPGNFQNHKMVRLDEALTELETIVVKDGDHESFKINGSDNLLMIYTSGTTGGSKWVMLSSNNLLANGASLAKRYSIVPEDRFYCFLPTHHMNALMITGMMPLTAGASIVLSDVLSVKNAKNYWQNLEKHKITVASLVPSIMALLNKLFPSGKPIATPELRFAFCGAAPLSAELWQDFEERFGLAIYQGYGLTETTCWAVSTPPDGPRHYDSVGVPLDTEIHIEPMEDSDALILEAPSIATRTGGEVWIRGPIVGGGYYNNAKLNRESLTADGFFRTGDLGRFDEDGFLHITGRLKEIIIRNGANVFSRDLDHILASHPAIKESKTIGIPDSLVGERIYCVCVLKEGATTQALEIKTWLQQQISQHMWPDAVMFMGFLPHGAAGKITTNVIRKIITGQLVEEILQSLNSWKFKRAQPSDLEAIKKKIQGNLISGEATHFLAYWGCGTRDHKIEQDDLTLKRLKEFAESVRKAPTVRQRVTLIFTDTHAANNRIPADRMNRYFSFIEKAAEELGFDTVRLSDLWKQAGLEWPKINEVMNSQAFAERWEAEPLRPRLIDQAAKHAEQGFQPEDAAKHYYAACLHEAKAVAEIYPKAMFTTYNHPDFDCISPNLEKFYLTSFKEGTSVKPWFYEA
ncbi:MAG: class I adenylate-forming enzyme family protein [Bdellovibrionota bacterium]